MESPKREPDNVPNADPRGIEEPTVAGPLPDRRERWLRSVVEHSSEIVTIVDPDGTMRYANPAFERLLGYDPEEAVGTMNVLDHVHPDDLPHVLEETEEALSGGGITSNKAEYRFRHRDGSWRWMESVGTYLLDDPRGRGVVVTSRDVTERKQSEERFKAQYKNIPVPTYTWQRTGDHFVLVDHNDAAGEYSRGIAGDLLGTKSTDLFCDWPGYAEAIERCFRERSIVRREMPWRTLRTAEDRRFVVTCVFAPPDLVMVQAEDVTERIETEERLRWQAQLLGAVGEAVIALDADGHVVYWNGAAEEMYGWSPEEAMGRRLREMVVPEDRRGQAQDIAAQLRAGLSWSGEFVVRRRDGTPFPVDATNTPVFGEDGGQVGVVSVLRDATERKQAEEALRRSEAEIFGILESITDAFFALDREWRFAYVNTQASGLFAKSREDIIGERIWEDPTFYPQYRRAVAEGVTARFEGYYPPLERWYSVRAYPSKSGLSVYLQDVTERKEFEERVRFQSGLLEAVGQAVIATDADGRVLYWNRNAERLYGWSAEEVMGRPVGDFGVPEELRGRLAEIVKEIRAGKSWSGEFTVLRKDGTRVPVMATDSPLYDERGNLSGIIGVSTDITERKKVEEALVESERRLSSLVSNSHAFVYRCLNEPGYPHEYASDRVLELTGYTPEDLLVGGGVRFGDLIVEEDRGRVWREVQQALGEGRGFELTYAIRRRDGCIRHVRDHGRGIRGEDADVVALEGMAYDVTEVVEARERLRESEHRYRTLIESIPAVTFVDRAEGSDEPLYVSPQVKRMLGYTPEEWMAGRLWRGRLHPDDRERIRASDERFEADGGAVDEEYRLLAKNGSVVWVREESVLVRGEGGELLFVQGILSDVTGRREAEEALLESEQRFRSSFEDAGIGMAMLSPEGRYLRANRAFCETVGYAEEELLGMTFHEITHPEDLEEDLERGRRVLAGEERTFSMEKRYVRKDGSSVWVNLTVSMVRGLSGEPLYSIAQAQNITGRKRMEEQLQRQALHDELTDLPNRKLFMDRLGLALERTRRRRGSKVAVLFMDLDGFKHVNDSLGHEVGDLLLTLVAKRLRRSLRPEDTLARFGGDEFVVLIEDVEGLEEAVQVAERIAGELGRPFVLEGRGLFASVSIGIGLGDAPSKSGEDLLRDADTAMYRAKDAQADYQVFDPAMYERAIVRLELENDLRRGLEAEEFVVNYQPIVDLATGEAWGMEALVRWDHPDRGLLNPSEFMPVSEESGLVVPVGEGVLEQACRQARRWQDDRRDDPPLVVSVNLSAVQLGRSDLARTVAGALRRTGLDPHLLSLDVTETAYIRVLEDKTAALDRLKGLGVGISIDDFGVGYSSLAYLKRLPADVLKIDRSFVKGVGEDARDTAIVRTVIDLAHTLGMKVVAEGVEDRAQAALLAEMGCEMGQGFYFSRPLAPDEVPGFLAG